MAIVSDPARNIQATVSDAARVGRLTALNVVEKQERQMEVWYDRVCAYFGALRFAAATGDREIRDRIVAAYAPCLSGAVKPLTDHVDNNLFGILPFELFRQTGKTEYLAAGKHLADEEFQDPRPDGLTRYTRFWNDDMYMVGALQARAHRCLREPIYAERGANHLLAYLERLQRRDGLIQHYPDTPVIWGRGCGWAAAGLTEVLMTLPRYTPKRAPLLKAYRKLVDALVKHQSADGMWRQIVDDPKAWPESSATGMFVFALATGVRERWISSEPYETAARRGWQALLNFIDPAGRVLETARGLAPIGITATDYLATQHLADDFHGLAAALWAATAMIALEI